MDVITVKADQQEEPAAKLMIHSIVIPKDVAETPEAAQEIAKQNGYKYDKVEDTTQGWVLPQTDMEMPMDGKEVLDLGNGITAIVCEMGSELGCNKPKKSADGEVTTEDSEEGKATDQGDGFTEEDKQKWVDAYTADVKATEEGGPGNPASWIADESLWEKAKRASEHALGKVSYPFVVWWYLQNGGKRKSGEPGSVKGLSDIPDDNPYLELSRQSNLLLGTLVMEIQKMSAKMDGIADLSLAKAKEVGNTTSNDSKVDPKPDEDITKSFDSLIEYQSILDRKLKRLGIASQ